MKHSKECLEGIDKQHKEFNVWVDAEIERLHRAGIDTSMRGWGHKYVCICGATNNPYEQMAQETQ